jgi:hypothetical protein
MLSGRMSDLIRTIEPSSCCVDRTLAQSGQVEAMCDAAKSATVALRGSSRCSWLRYSLAAMYDMVSFLLVADPTC